MQPPTSHPSDFGFQTSNFITRRWFLRDCTIGFGGMALNSLLSRDSLGAPAPLAPRGAHHAAKAKRVIYMFNAGAPSHLELFDYKPELEKRSGQLPPAELLKNYRAAFIKPNSALLGPKFKFRKNGASGMELSEVIPHISGIADEICLIRTMQTDAVNHAPAQILMNTGNQNFGRPSFGAWTLYGLGCESEDLPGYVVLTSAKGTSGGASNYGSGFLPNMYGGVPFRSTGDPLLYLSNPAGYDENTQRASLDTLNALNHISFAGQGDPDIAARIQSFEMAYRLQSSAPELIDLSDEPKHVLDMYGIKDVKEPGYARNCLLARRLIERGVRFVQLFDWVWDHHSGLDDAFPKKCQQVDRPMTALLNDLEQRGLLEDTLVVWGGEFGRTPMQENRGGVAAKSPGRDHHVDAYSLWLAGGGVKGGISHGETDEIGYNAVLDKVQARDLHATILHQLGLDPLKLTYPYQGLNQRIVGVKPCRVLKEILA